MLVDGKLFGKHASRLFIPEGESCAVDRDHGLPLKPDKWRTILQQSRHHWNDSPCVVVLGEPGSGKSREFESWHDELRQAGQPAFLIALRDFNRDRTLARLAGKEGDALRVALAGTSTTPITLFLDALDEGRLRFSEVLQNLVDKLKEAPRNRPLHLRLSCRSRDWRAVLDRNDLKGLYPGWEDQSGIDVIEILPLDLGAIRELATEWLGEDRQVNAFVDAAIDRNVLPLAGQPLTLGMMLEVFEKDGRLGGNRAEIFDRACALLTSERNPVHREKGKQLTAPADRLKYARHLAALSVLSNQAEIYIPDSDRPMGQALPGTLAVSDKDRLRETLDTGLFTQSLPGAFRFLHPSLADFLAAQWVAQRIDEGLRPRAVFPLLQGGESGVPTPLRNLTAWLATLNSDIREQLLHNDPVTLVRGDVGTLAMADRLALVQALAARYASRDFQGEVDDFSDLACCGLPADILADLFAQVRSSAVRRMALDMCLAGKRADMADLAWQIAANPSEHQTLRRQATRLICELAPAEYAQRLAALLVCPPDEDPDDTLAGTILNGLYPEYLNIEQALSVLRAPRKEQLIGMFRYFWQYEFPSRIPDTDEIRVLDTLVEQISQSEGFSIGDPRPKIFLELLARSSQKPCFEDIGRVARWLAPLCLNGAVEMHTDSDQKTKPIHEAIADNPRLKQALIEHDIASCLDETSYEPWHTPFPSGCLNTGDFDWLAELCDREGLRDDVRVNLFSKLDRLYAQGEYFPTTCFDRLAALGERHPNLGREWASRLTCNLDDKGCQHYRESARERFESRAAGAARLGVLMKQISSIEQGLAPGIFYAVDQLWRIGGRGFFALPDIGKLAEATSPDFASAAAQGFRAVWSNPPPEARNWNHPEDSISYWLIVAGYGLELAEAEGPIDWASASESQLETASLIAFRHVLNSMPAWFGHLYGAHPDRLEPRLIGFLNRDSHLPGREYPSVTAKLVRAAETSPLVAEHIIRWFFEHPDQSNLSFLEYLLRLLLQRPESDAANFLSIQAESAMESEAQDLEKTSLLLAGWWLTDWQSAQMRLEDPWFSDDANRFERIRTFVLQLKSITGCSGWGWPSRIPFEANVALAPSLHLEYCPPIERTWSEITPDDDFRDAREAVLRAIAAGPAEQAGEAFRKLLRLPQFAFVRPLIEHYLDELERRTIDEGWQPPTPVDVEQILSQSARLVRDEAEFYRLAADLCESDLREALRADASLIPLLWKGTKKGEREPDDEKALQAVLINQLYWVLRGTPLLHAREPETFDAKKEDCRLLIALENGNKAAIAIEIKQAMHAELWTAPKTQLVEKYMREHRARFGLYLVGWYGTGQAIVAKPNQRKRNRFLNPADLERELQSQIDQDIYGTGKSVKVLVFDCSV